MLTDEQLKADFTALFVRHGGISTREGRVLQLLIKEHFLIGNFRELANMWRDLANGEMDSAATAYRHCADSLDNILNTVVRKEREGV